MAARFELPSLAVDTGPAIQASDPEITRHVTGPANRFPPAASRVLDHSPTGFPRSKWAAMVSRRGGLDLEVYSSTTNAPDRAGEAATDGVARGTGEATGGEATDGGTTDAGGTTDGRGDANGVGG